MNVLLVPGLYAPFPGMETLQHLTYSSVVPLWESEGHTVQVHQFGWDGNGSLEDKQARLLDTIDAMPGQVHAIGASAGGLAVLAAMRDRPEKIEKVVTVASPLSVDEQHFKDLERKLPAPVAHLLKDAYDEVDLFLQDAEPAILSNIVSVHGVRDNRVPVAWSHQLPGIACERLPVSGHGLIIMSAISAYRKRVRKLLE